MKTRDPKSVDLPTYAVLVSAVGEIMDIRAQHCGPRPLDPRIIGRAYTQECASRYRLAIKELLNRERPLLSAVMPPPTLGLDVWFAVVGVPLSDSKESGALFVHTDISAWVTNSGAQKAQPEKLSMDLVQKAMATTFVRLDAEEPKSRRSKIHYDGIESLTARQRDVLKLIGMGKSNVEIAQDLSCSLNTVKRHVTAVLQKLKLPNRTRAAMLINQTDFKSEN
ncbi:helix-turn-helix transcriptional regulator [Hyphomicrobium sp. B1]|uniref:helix-turn-helix transcriptional regulator n=1 Tax=Hyphomicrobium sp. B1 TaxID=3075651 RepID=UPI003C2E8970